VTTERETPAPAPGPGDERPLDQRFRELGVKLLQRLNTMFKVGRTYKVGNSVFAQQVEGFLNLVAPGLAETEELVLARLDTDFYLNGYRLPIRPTNVRFLNSALQEFGRRRISAIRITRGLEGHEVEKFFEFFMQFEVYVGQSMLDACVGAGIKHMLPAVHVSTDSQDSDFLTGTPQPESQHNEEDSRPDRRAPAAEDAWGRFPEPAVRGKSRVPRGAVRKSYRAAVLGTRSLLAATSLHDHMELKHAKRVVQPLVDGAFESEPVVVGLTSLGHHDEYTYAHAVNTCMVAVTMGHFLGLDRRALADIGVAALFHDVGKNTVSHLITRPFDEFTEDERAAAERHPVEGAKLIARSTSLNATTLRCMRVALEHHMHPGGQGYPAVPKRWTTSLLSRIVAVADCYVSLQTYRSRHGANVTPYQALGMMLGPMRTSFDPVMLWALVQSVGLYPPGQMVELSNGTIALVLGPNPADVERPNVRVVARADSRRLTPEEAVEHRPIPPELSVKRALKSEEYPDDSEEAAA
jgi:HD-GYP domain-containing protein (c-di-GMP phosphodiesterase class II)